MQIYQTNTHIYIYRMNTHTKKIISDMLIGNANTHEDIYPNFTCNIKHNLYIDIANLNIEGSLDLFKHKNTSVMICPNNKITKIINIPITIEFLNCSNNNITELNFSPSAVYGISGNNKFTHKYKIDCRSNRIKAIYNSMSVPQILSESENLKDLKKSYILLDNFDELTILTFHSYFNEQINDLPQSITYLKLDHNFNQSIDNLPINLKYLSIENAYCYDTSLDNLPNGLETLYISHYFQMQIDNLPNSLIKLTLGKMFDNTINNLPTNLIYLTTGKKFNQSVDNLPELLEYLTFGELFNQPVDNLPKNLKYLEFGDNFNYPVNHLPSNLDYLIFGFKFNQLVDELPNSLTHLLFNVSAHITHFTLPIAKLPENLVYLQIPNETHYIHKLPTPSNPNCYILFR